MLTDHAAVDDRSAFQQADLRAVRRCRPALHDETGTTSGEGTTGLLTHSPSWTVALRGVGGNAVLLAPLAALLWFLSTWSALQVLALAAVTSLNIEVLQATVVPGRMADVDDLILNVAGAAVVMMVLAAVERRLERSIR